VTNGRGVAGNRTIDLAAATGSLMGGVVLAGDLGGTATSPRVLGLARIYNITDPAYGIANDGVTDDLDEALPARVTSRRI
jgi:hypothetical protein